MGSIVKGQFGDITSSWGELPRVTLAGVADDLATRVKEAIRRSDQADRRAADRKTIRNDLIREAVASKAVTVAELVKTTPMSKTQIERVLRGESSGNKKPAHTATSDGSSGMPSSE